ncbi:MAG: cation diffusion facilitator family transporter [Chloroflexota bacterium]|nr:cation diffusion facilitator family transporter [Chloroflexota bacterium]
MRDNEGYDHDAHAGHDHAAHDHPAHDHAAHDHAADVGHDHAGHDHAAHDHAAEEAHAHAGHDHAAHDHAAEEAHAHAGHDHAAHDHAAEGAHDHAAHAGHDHDDHAGHDHGGHGHGHHDHSHDFRSASKKSLWLALVLISTYMVAEVIGGLVSGSLALLADAGHMLTDAAAIVMALVAIWIGQREASVERTFGYHRTEILAALANTFTLWLIAGWILFEAYHRIRFPESEVIGLPVLLVGIGGFLVNVAAAWILHRSSGESLNVEGAFQHVLADLLGSVGVIISAILIMAFNWQIADPILSVVIAFLIVYNTRRLIVSILNVLLEGAPEHVDVYALCHDLEEFEGVTLIHDVHVWTITQGNVAFTAHILMDRAYAGDLNAVTSEMKDLLHNKYQIGHVTIQLEHTTADCTEDHHVGHLLARARD